LFNVVAAETAQIVHVALPTNSELALRIFVAAALGGLIGAERESGDQAAGLRTHISISVGACLFGLISAYGFQEFVTTRAATVYQVDVTRVASQIVIGVGFLGGGAILKDGNNVKGLTTAASIWVCAAVGLGCALGMYFLTITTTVVLLSVLVLLKGPRKWLRKKA
jgi:putative Mg2+ transporter-C (MgtC) family protein